MRQRVNAWMGLGENPRQRRAFPHVASSYSDLVQGCFPDVFGNTAENIREGVLTY